MILPVTITTVKSCSGPLAKEFGVDEKSDKEKIAAANMYDGKARRITTPFNKLIRIFNLAGCKNALIYGTCPEEFKDEVQIVVAGKEIPSEGIISRTQDYFKYHADPGVIMIDYDPSEYGQDYSEEELLDIFGDIFPAFNDAAMLVRGSISAGVHFVGESPQENGGLHFYLPVLDASDIPRFGKLLFHYLWLNGHGYIALSACGRKLVRTLIDPAVFSPERLDFVGKPIIADERLTYTPPKISEYEGGYLDTSKLKDLTTEQELQLKTLINDAKKAIAPEAEKKAAEWKAKKINALVDSGVAVEKATRVIDDMLKGGCKELPEDFVLEFTDQSVRVSDVLSNPQQFDGKALADPIEGKSYGKTTAKFWWNDGNPIISSFAHGVQTTYFLQKNWKDKFTAFVEDFNKTHANVMIGTKNRIMRIEKGIGYREGLDIYCFYERDSIKKVYDNQKIKVGEKKEKNGKIVDVYENPVLAWVFHKDSRAYKNGIIFLPGKDAGEGCFNTWRGFKVSPHENRAILKRIKFHLKHVVSDGDQELYEYLVKWIAYTFQFPDRPAGSAPTMRGEKGCGKGTLGHFLRIIWGVHALYISNAKHLVGNFNGHLTDVCFLFADEAFFSGDSKHEGILKGLITEPVIAIERKGIDVIQQPNYLKILMATNSKFAVPASRDERRYCVFDVSSSKIGDKAYFDALHEDIDSEEVQAAFLYEMLHLDLSGWHIGNIPESAGLRAQRYHSMKPHQQWLGGSLINGQFELFIKPSDDEDNVVDIDKWHEEMTTEDLFESYKKWCDDARKGEYCWRRLKTDHLCRLKIDQGI